MAAQKRCVLFRMRAGATAPSGQRQAETPSPVHEADLRRLRAAGTPLAGHSCPDNRAHTSRDPATALFPLTCVVRFTPALAPPRFGAFSLAIRPPEFCVAAGRHPPAVACTATGVR